MPLIIQLTQNQQNDIANFFLQNPLILNREHFEHTRSPLDNLCHYMWEELQEDYHLRLKQEYLRLGRFTDGLLIQWFTDEINELNEYQEEDIQMTEEEEY